MWHIILSMYSNKLVITSGAGGGIITANEASRQPQLESHDWMFWRTPENISIRFSGDKIGLFFTESWIVLRDNLEIVASKTGIFSWCLKRFLYANQVVFVPKPKESISKGDKRDIENSTSNYLELVNNDDDELKDKLEQNFLSLCLCQQLHSST